jgi:hypothetical protein
MSNFTTLTDEQLLAATRRWKEFDRDGIVHPADRRVVAQARAVQQALIDCQLGIGSVPYTKVVSDVPFPEPYNGFRPSNHPCARYTFKQLSDYGNNRAMENSPIIYNRILGWRHIANEWADMAINGIQAIRNVRDGIQTVDEVHASLISDLKYCREVNDAQIKSVKVSR